MPARKSDHITTAAFISAKYFDRAKPQLSHQLEIQRALTIRVDTNTVLEFCQQIRHPVNTSFGLAI